MNMLAHAAGFRNFQHMRRASTSAERLAIPPERAADMKLVERRLQQFDNKGRLTRWPSRRAVQDLALWAFWARLPVSRKMTEKEVNTALFDGNLFGDPAILRRSLVTLGLVTRNTDCTDYARVEQRPSVEARALLAALKVRPKLR